MGTSQHGVDVNAQPEVLDHLRERMSETDEFLPRHGDGAAGCTKGRWTVSERKKSEGKQGSWVVSVGKWFADENEDTGLHIAEDSKFFGIASSIESFSNEGKELIIQYQAKSSLCQASYSNPSRPMQRTPDNLIRSSECLSKCCPTFNPTCDQEEDEC